MSYKIIPFYFQINYLLSSSTAFFSISRMPGMAEVTLFQFGISGAAIGFSGYAAVVLLSAPRTRHVLARVHAPGLRAGPYDPSGGLCGPPRRGRGRLMGGT